MLSSISTGVDFRGTRGALGAIESTDAFSIGFMESAVMVSAAGKVSVRSDCAVDGRAI